MFKVSIKAQNLREHFDFFSYIKIEQQYKYHEDYSNGYPLDYIDDANGFLVPKESFEYKSYLRHYGDIEGFNFFDDYLVKNLKYELYSQPSREYNFGKNEIFTFIFPDEETAVYFELKYNN